MNKATVTKYVIQLNDGSFVEDYDFTLRTSYLEEAGMFEKEDADRCVLHMNENKRKEVKTIRPVVIEYGLV